MKSHQLVLLVALLVSNSGCSASAGGGAPSPEPPPPDAATSTPPPPGASESCDGYDDDLDGRVDEACPCAPGATQACFDGSRAQSAAGVCEMGTQRCEGEGEFSAWGPCVGSRPSAPELCGNGVDEDCDGVDPPCDRPPGDAAVPTADAGTPSEVVEVSLFLLGDCITASCPAEAPYPIGCNVLFSPGDERGCVASRPDDPVVYFQAGDECNAGLVTGTLRCSTAPGPPLTQSSCPINKPTPMHVRSRSECPEITDR